MELEDDIARFESPFLGFGAPKKEVMLELVLDFFELTAVADRWLAFRLRLVDVAMARSN